VIAKKSPTQEDFVLERREFMHGAAAIAAGSALSLTDASAQAPTKGDPKGETPPPRNWADPSTAPYPDAAFEVFDPRFAAYNAGTTSLRRIASGGIFTEGPVWFGDQHRLIFSDIPKNQLLEYNTMTGEVRVFRDPSNYTNGNTRDWQGRLLSAEQGTRRVTRTEYDGSITVIADKYEGKPLNSPNGVVVRKNDNAIYFTDPSYGIKGDHEGNKEEPELPRNVYRVDARSGAMSVVAGDFSMPNGLCFSPDGAKMYISDTGILGGPEPRATLIRVYDVEEDGKLTNEKLFHDFKDTGTGIADDMRVDIDGNLWCAGGWSENKNFNGVSVFAPDGSALGRIVLPEVAANLCFGGHHHNTLYICASTSVYAIDVNTRGTEL
jgi:gluconolactonase